MITIVEFLSPSNKLPGEGRRQYKQKQDEVFQAGINLVEIDLTRQGERDLMHADDQLPHSDDTEYLATVFRGFGFDRCEVYRMPLRERLPSIRILLRKDDPDVVLDIQKLIDQAYDEGRYDDIDYSRPPRPPLEGSDARWAEQVLKATKTL